MAVLNLITFSINQPEALPWEWLLLVLFDFVPNYGWRIMLFTFCLKMLLLPLDIMQKYAMRKNQKIAERIKPQLDKLKAAYADDPTTLSTKQMELNRREGYSYLKPCLPMIVTLVVFLWFFASMNYVGQYMNMKQYLEFNDTYTAAYNIEYAKASDKVAATEAGQQAVLDYYNTKFERTNSFLWIKNMWTSDVPWVMPIKTHSEFIKATGEFGSKPQEHGINPDAISSVQYNVVTAKLTANHAPNGYLILVFLAVGLSIVSQMYMQKQQKLSGMDTAGNMAGSMKMMQFMMPVLLGWFALSSSAVFALYLIVNSTMTLLINLSSTAIVRWIEIHTDRRAAQVIHHYGRPDPNKK